MKWLLAFCVGGVLCGADGQTYEEKAVAAVLMAEAWSEGARGMTAVAEVIHERAIEKAETPLQVIAAHRGRVQAFSCLNGTTVERLIRKFSGLPDYQAALQIAETACRTPDQLPDLTKSADHFTRKTERPRWTKGKRPVAIIGRHAFYRLNAPASGKSS